MYSAQVTPVVSVILVCRDAAETIERTLDSILEQEYTAYELIVKDGGSSDGTLDVLRSYDSRFDGRMRVVSEPDTGIYDAMNAAVRLACGEYVGFINADDWYLPGALESLVEVAHGSENPDLVMGGMCKGDPSDPLRCVDVPPARWPRGGQPDVMPACHEAMLFRRDLHDRYGFYDVTLRVAADFDFVLRCLENGARIAFTDAIIMHYSPGGESDSRVAAVEREYRDVRVRHGRSWWRETLRSEWSIAKGRAFGSLRRLPFVGPVAERLYARSRSRVKPSGDGGVS